MSGLFGGDSSPPPFTPPPPPPPPVIEDTSGQAQDAADQLRRRKGAQASILTGSLGAAAPDVGSKSLLGS
jgi:hypothetical protein